MSGFFSKAALEFLLQSGRQPDVIHCHDWSSAIVARSYWEDYHNYGLPHSSVVFTIHNLGYGQDLIAQAMQYVKPTLHPSPRPLFSIRCEKLVQQEGAHRSRLKMKK